MPLKQTPFWGRKTFCVITGASQGIGRHFAIEFSRKVSENSVFLLLARSSKGLAETHRLIQDTGPNVHVTCRSVDLMHTNPDELTQSIRGALGEFKASPLDFDLALIIHNAGSVGDVSEKACDMSDPKKWTDYLSLNLVSVSCLSSIFLQTFPDDPLKETCIVNITSLCGVQPFKSMGYYCVGKASREMYFKVLAEESPALNVLSYSPGPVDTEMVTEVIHNIGIPEMKDMFVSYRENLLTPQKTVMRCMDILAGRKYTSGGRVDYFDDGF